MIAKNLSCLAIMVVLLAACTSTKRDMMHDFRLKEVSYQIEDPKIAKLVQASEKRSLLRKGQRYNQDKIAQERERIAKVVKQGGFADFDKAFVTFDVDTTIAPKRFTVQTVIKKE